MCLSIQSASHLGRDLEPTPAGDPAPRMGSRALGRRHRGPLRRHLAGRLAESGDPAQGRARERTARSQPPLLPRGSRSARPSPGRAPGDVGAGPRSPAQGGQGAMSAPEQARVVELRVRLEATPEQVFPFLVEPERYVRWQGVKADLDPRPARVSRGWMDGDSVARRDYAAVEPPKRGVL